MAWQKAEKKLPALKYLKGFWTIFCLYGLVIVILAVALVVSAVIQGEIALMASLAILVSIPFLLVTAFVAQPTLLLAMVVETAAFTVCANLLSAWFVSKALVTEPVEDGRLESHGEHEVVDTKTGEIYDRRDFRGAPVALS